MYARCMNEHTHTHTWGDMSACSLDHQLICRSNRFQNKEKKIQFIAAAIIIMAQYDFYFLFFFEDDGDGIIIIIDVK